MYTQNSTRGGQNVPFNRCKSEKCSSFPVHIAFTFRALARIKTFSANLAITAMIRYIRQFGDIQFPADTDSAGIDESIKKNVLQFVLEIAHQ